MRFMLADPKGSLCTTPTTPVSTFGEGSYHLHGHPIPCQLYKQKRSHLCIGNCNQGMNPINNNNNTCTLHRHEGYLTRPHTLPSRPHPPPPHRLPRTCSGWWFLVQSESGRLRRRRLLGARGGSPPAMPKRWKIPRPLAWRWRELLVSGRTTANLFP